MTINPIGINPMCIRVLLDIEDVAAAIAMYLETQKHDALQGAEIEDVCFTDSDGEDIYPEEVVITLT